MRHTGRAAGAARRRRGRGRTDQDDGHREAGDREARDGDGVLARPGGHADAHARPSHTCPVALPTERPSTVRPTPTPTPPAPKPTPPATQPATTEPQPADPTTPAAPAGPATAGVILSPSGNFYRAGEFCPTADLGESTVDSHGTSITCITESGGHHWHY